MDVWRDFIGSPHGTTTIPLKYNGNVGNDQEMETNDQSKPEPISALSSKALIGKKKATQ